MRLSKILKNTETLWLSIILLVAAILRFYHYGTFSYSNDELSALNRLNYNTFSELVEKGFYVDGHPGGIQVFLWQWVRLFGDNEWMVRFPFVIMGIVSVWMSYKVAKLMVGTTAGLFTAAAITFLQFPLLYSQIARPYGSGMLFCLMLVYFWIKIFFTENGELNLQKPKFSILAGFTISASLCMYNHYFSFLFALIVGLSGFVVARRNNVFYYIAAALVAAALFVPHIPITLNHLTYKGVGLWLGVPGKMWIFEHLYFIFDQSLLILLLFFGTLLSLKILNQDSKSYWRYKLFLAFWFLAPILIGFIYSIKVNPVLQHPVLIFSFPFFIILMFSSAGNVLTNKKQWILAVFLSTGLISTTVVNAYYQKQHFGEFKDIAKRTAQWQQQYGDTAITKVISINAPYYIDYYLNRENTTAKFELYEINGSDGLALLSEIVKKSKTPYFEYALTKPAPSEGDDIIRSIYPYVVEMQNYGNYSSVMLFSKAKGLNYEQANNLTEIKTLKAELNKDTVVLTTITKPEIVYKMDSAQEYSPGIELNFDEFSTNKYLVLTAETEIYSPVNSGESALVISIETLDGKSLVWKGAVAKYIEIPGKWCNLINTLKMDSAIPKGSRLKVYFWNKDKKLVYLKNLQCRVFRYKPDN